MLNIQFRYISSGSIKSNLKSAIIDNNIPERHHNQPIHFTGNPDFIITSKVMPSVNKDIELRHISDILKTLGVKELEIGNNVDLAILLKRAMYRVKMLGFDIPTRIRCESKFF